MDLSRISPSRKGAWAVNVSKHLRSLDATHQGLDELHNLTFAGQCGDLLITLSGDNDEQLEYSRVRRQARACAIDPTALDGFLKTLRFYGCIDWDASGNYYEVLAHSRQRVLQTTNNILENTLPKHSYDEVLIELLEFCLVRPRLTWEVKNFLTTKLYEEDADALLALVANLHILGVLDLDEEQQKVYFNTHEFGENARDIGQNLVAISQDQYEEVNKAIEYVERYPAGVFPESLPVTDTVKRFVIGMGLVDQSIVITGEGPVSYLTSPRLRPTSVGTATESLERDVFHHAKMLLTSFRYGELRSTQDRGRILNPGALVNSLIHSGIVGPCTAIGQDYVNLETHGVVSTTPAKGTSGDQFYMELRRQEPAQITLDLLNSGRSDAIDAQALTKNLTLPTGYIGPEIQQKAAYRRTAEQDAKSLERVMKDIRTLRT